MQSRLASPSFLSFPGSCRGVFLIPLLLLNHVKDGGLGGNGADLDPYKLLSAPAGRGEPDSSRVQQNRALLTTHARNKRLSVVVVCSRAGDVAGVVVGHGVRHPHRPPGLPQVWKGKCHRGSEPQV